MSRPRRAEVAEGDPRDEIVDQDRQVVDHHHFVQGDDPGMPELGDDPGLGVEPLDILAGLDQVGLGDLEGDRPVQLDVEGTPDGAERPLADLLQELELAQPPSRGPSTGSTRGGRRILVPAGIRPTAPPGSGCSLGFQPGLLELGEPSPVVVGLRSLPRIACGSRPRGGPARAAGPSRAEPWQPSRKASIRGRRPDFQTVSKPSQTWSILRAWESVRSSNARRHGPLGVNHRSAPPSRACG